VSLWMIALSLAVAAFVARRRSALGQGALS